MSATAGLNEDQTGIALQAVIDAINGSGEIDCEEIAKSIYSTPERAFEAVSTVVESMTRLITTRVFGGDEALHSEFVKFAVREHRKEFAEASEKVARHQSSRPMLPLVEKHRAYVKAEAAKAAAKRAPKPQEPKSPKSFEHDDPIRHLQAETRRLERERQGRYWWQDDE